MRLSLPVLALLLLSNPAFAVERTAKSCEYVDVKAQVDLSSPGDRVLVPAGNCVWIQNLSYRSLKLQFAGKDSSGSYLSTITLDMGASIYGLGDGAEFTGAMINSLTAPTTNNGAPAVLTMDGQNFRAHHYDVKCPDFCTALYAYGAQVGKHPTGLVDHLNSIGGRVTVYGDGKDDWSDPSTIGVAGAVGVVTVEDSTIDMTLHCQHGHCGNAIDSELSGRYIFRHNKVINTGVEAHSNQGMRNARNWEVSDNDFVSTNGWFAPMFLRGGTGVGFNNTIRGYSLTITLDNVNTTCAYPCKDQIGRGRDLPDGTQQLEPAYFWNNTFDGVATVPRVSAGAILPDRDYFNSPRPGYAQSPYPHPLQGGTAPPIPIPPTPIPVPNMPPAVVIKAPADGFVITTKTFSISIEATDDVGITWQELSINGQLVKAAATATLTYSWNTSPYKGKTVIISAVAKDADGASTRRTATVTVKK